MANTREIKRRMKAVSNITRITKTMQMIATARFQASLRRVTESQPYTRKIRELIGELAGNVSGVAHPLLRTNEGKAKRELLLVISSNRGLCGGYNANILRNTIAFKNNNADLQLDIEAVGKKAAAYFKFIKVPLAAFHTNISDAPKYAQVERLADHYMQSFIDGTFDAVRVVYMKFESVGKQTPTILQLLPLQSPVDPAADAAKPKATVDYDFSPDPARLLAELLPVTVKTQLYQCFNEAVLGEHIARMVAMKNATDAAQKMSKSLTRQFNRARQASITTELSEIISGAAALE